MLYSLSLNTVVVYILKTIPVQVKGKRLRPFSSIFMKEGIQSIQLVIILLGKLIGWVGKKKDKNTKRTIGAIYTTLFQEDKKEKNCLRNYK